MKKGIVEKSFSDGGKYIALLQENDKVKSYVSCNDLIEAKKIVESWENGTYQLLVG